MRAPPLIAAFLALALLAACSQDAPTQQSEPAPEPPAAEPNIAEDAEASGEQASIEVSWKEILPGGETRCSDGSPYKFFARANNPKKLLVYLQGGGGCWKRQTCDLAMSPSYIPAIGRFHPSAYDGIFDFENEANPFKDYSVVMVPYCTGDAHLGARDKVYDASTDDGEKLTIMHRGRKNVQAALDYTYTEFSGPLEIFVTGSSAGAIPSPYYALKLAERYPNARITQLGDGAGGYRNSPESQDDPHAAWDSNSVLKAEDIYAEETFGTFGFKRIYAAAAKANPQILFSQYDTAEDSVQKDFLAITGINTNSLIDLLNANHKDISAEASNFRSYIAGGESHTILAKPEFYTFTVGDRSVRDWVTDLAAGRKVENVACTDCSVPEFTGIATPEPLKKMWANWQDPSVQYVEPFQIFDNLYYVGIDWVAAYVLETSDGLILIDSLYGKWVNTLFSNIQKVGLNPSDIKYVITTHGHFDHAGGVDLIQRRTGARIVMAEEDWELAEAPADHPLFAFSVPTRDIVAADGDVIELGDTKVELFKTPGHTKGVLTLRYQVRDGEDTHAAITLGGVGLNFSGVKRTESYIESYKRLQDLQKGVAVNLPNHAGMANVFGLRDALKARAPGDPHPFVNETRFTEALEGLIANAEQKLTAEKAGTAKDPMAELQRALNTDDQQRTPE